MVSRWALAFCLLTAPAAWAGAPARQAPWAAWKTMATAHYRIHYPPALADWAGEVAGRIEAIHDRVTALVGYQSPGPIRVVLADPMAEANGLAVPLLSAPHVVLWRTEPRSDSEVGGSMSSWTDVLLAHELTHIHHLTRPRRPGAAQGVQSVFSLPLGPLLLKSPRWVSEGYATLVEGRVTGYGRPHSAFRAAVLRQWARAGKLPPYQALNRDPGFLGANMAYLAGSAYLEWLERQRPDQPDILPRLWKQLAGNPRPFEAAFQATFGFSAQDGYQRFQAETSHDALEWEARIKAQGLREGELWLRVEGGVADLGVSPDGTKLLGRLETRANPGLRVWDLGARPKAAAPRGRIDPFNAVADAAPEFAAPKVLAALPSLDHQPPRDAEWLDDQTIRFQRKHADREGTLRPRPTLWRLDGGVRADPGTLPAASRTLVPVHRPGGWVLEMDGQAIPLPGQPAGRAWVDAGRRRIYAGCEIDGIWNLVRVPYRTVDGRPRFDPAQRLTRTLSAAWNPAPAPDGDSLFYTSLDARGMEIRRLDLRLPALAEQPAPEPRVLDPDTVMPPAPVPGALPPAAAPPAAVPYRAADNLWNHLTAGLSLTPSGHAYQLGAAGADLLGRLSWQALAGLGDGPGPRGAMVGLASSAWAWKPSVAVFSALERPSLQRTAPVPADRERRGAEWALAFDQMGDTRIWVSPVLAWERVAPLGPEPAYARGLAGVRAGLEALWARGPWGLGLAPGLQVYEGSSLTSGPHRWNALRGSLKVRLETPVLPLTLKGEQGSIRGNPRETFQLGGVTTSLVPESLDLARVAQPALPALSATGDRFLRWRGELGGILRCYAEGTAMWRSGEPRGPFQRVLGLEFALDPLVRQGSEQVLRRMQVQVGAHRPLDGAMKGRTVATVTLMLRP